MACPPCGNSRFWGLLRRQRHLGRLGEPSAGGPLPLQGSGDLHRAHLFKTEEDEERKWNALAFPDDLCLLAPLGEGASRKAKRGDLSSGLPGGGEVLLKRCFQQHLQEEPWLRRVVGLPGDGGKHSSSSSSSLTVMGEGAQSGGDAASGSIALSLFGGSPTLVRASFAQGWL